MLKHKLFENKDMFVKISFVKLVIIKQFHWFENLRVRFEFRVEIMLIVI